MEGKRGWGGRGAYLSLSERGRGWGGHLFETGRLLTFSACRMGAYSRWTLIQGWALIRINTVVWEIQLIFTFSEFLRTLMHQVFLLQSE